jgi:hypothetical protein
MSDSKKAHQSLINTLVLIEASGLGKTPEWKNVTKAIKNFLNKESVDMTRASEKMPVKINFNDPSLPITKNQ